MNWSVSLSDYRDIIVQAPTNSFVIVGPYNDVVRPEMSFWVPLSEWFAQGAVWIRLITPIQASAAPGLPATVKPCFTFPGPLDYKPASYIDITAAGNTYADGGWIDVKSFVTDHGGNYRFSYHVNVGAGTNLTISRMTCLIKRY